MPFIILCSYQTLGITLKLNECQIGQLHFNLSKCCSALPEARAPANAGAHAEPLHMCTFHPIYYPRTTLALPPSRNSDPGSHSGPSSLPTTARAFFFSSREELSIFFPRRLAWNCAYPCCWALSAVDPLFCIFANKVKSHHGGNRTQGPTPGVFEGTHQTTGATGSAPVVAWDDVRQKKNAVPGH